MTETYERCPMFVERLQRALHQAERDGADLVEVSVGNLRSLLAAYDEVCDEANALEAADAEINKELELRVSDLIDERNALQKDFDELEAKYIERGETIEMLS